MALISVAFGCSETPDHGAASDTGSGGALSGSGGTAPALPATAGSGGVSAGASGGAGGLALGGAAGGPGGVAGLTGGAPGSPGGSGGVQPGLDAGPPVGGVDPGASAAAVDQLRTHLAIDPASRPLLDDQPFAAVPLTAGDADVASATLWADLSERIRSVRASEHAAKSLTLDGVTLRYETRLLGDAPPEGRDLFISMHGGGSGPASQNDAQWSNQIALGAQYNPEHSVWVAPRAPTDDWNMWFKDHIDGLFDRLITNMIVFEGIQPNRVYLTGYSAGGDGVYGLAPRTADRWAGAAMSAGHPNGVSVANLRNVAFALHAGGNDVAFERNQVTQEYIDLFSALQAGDPGGYVHQGMVHPGLPHWMNLADAVAIPFLQGHTRSPAPDRVVWEQHDEKTHRRMYWLALDEAEERTGTRVVVSYVGQTVAIEEAEGLSSLRIWLNDDMLDLDQPVTISRAGTPLFEGMAARTISILAETLEGREDPALVYTAEVRVEL